MVIATSGQLATRLVHEPAAFINTHIRRRRWSCHSRLIAGWLYNGAGSSVLIAGLFHAMHNAIVNSTGPVAVVGLPEFEVLVIMAGIVVRGAAIITIATGHLGVKRS